MNFYRALLAIFLSFTGVTGAFSQTNYDYGYSFENPLVDAADQGKDHEISRLIRSGMSPNSKGLFNSTALMRASLRGHESTVHTLLEAGADVQAKDIGGATALHFAARAGNRKIVEHLLRFGANPEAVDNEGYTPLKRSVLSQNASVVDALVKKGADLDSKGSTPFSARDLITSSKNEKIRDTVQTDTKSLEQQPLLSVPTEEIEVKPIDTPAEQEVLDSKQDKKIEPTIVKEEKAKDISQELKPKSEVKVEEAIKVSDDTDLAAEEVKIEPAKDQTSPGSATTIDSHVVKTVRNLSMEIGTFNSEEEALIFWQELTEKKIVPTKDAKLVIDNTTNITNYKIRYDGYTKAKDVFENCKSIKTKSVEKLCYVIHNVY